LRRKPSSAGKEHRERKTIALLPRCVGAGWKPKQSKIGSEEVKGPGEGEGRDDLGEALHLKGGVGATVKQIGLL